MVKWPHSNRRNVLKTLGLSAGGVYGHSYIARTQESNRGNSRKMPDVKIFNFKESVEEVEIKLINNTNNRQESHKHSNIDGNSIHNIPEFFKNNGPHTTIIENNGELRVIDSTIVANNIKFYGNEIEIYEDRLTLGIIHFDPLPSESDREDETTPSKTPTKTQTQSTPNNTVTPRPSPTPTERPQEGGN